MRRSKRADILAAALRVVERDGVRAVTLDAVADEAGLTRGGVLYHFGNRETLLAAMEQHLLDGWEEQLEAVAGAPAAELTPQERLLAYARVSSTSATSAQLALVLEFSKQGQEGRAWSDVSDRWSVGSAEAAADPKAFDRFIARLAADGLWVYESLEQVTLDDELRQRVAARIVDMIASDAGA